MKPATAVFLAGLKISGGGSLYPDIGATGGTLLGVPVIVSGNTPSGDASSPSEDLVILIDAAELLLAEGDLVLDASRNAVVQLSDSADSPPSAATTLASLWQFNLLGVRVVRFINWKMRRSGAVAYLSGLATP